MFDNLPETNKVRQRGKAIAFFAAIAIHALAGVFFGVASLLAVEPIEPPTITVVFMSAAAPPPPPPPPPAAKPKPKTEEAKPKPVDIKPPSGPVQPVLIPEKPPEPVKEEVAADSGEEGMDGGVEGGVEGGVAGGVPGGSLGDTGTGNEPLRVGGDVEAPVIVSQVQPRYPEAAKQARIQGIVILEAIINTEGQIEDVKVLRGHALLEQAAIDAIHKWKFKPGKLNGNPVRVYFTLTVNFTLK